jgi:hypothetical protein
VFGSTKQRAHHARQHICQSKAAPASTDAATVQLPVLGRREALLGLAAATFGLTTGTPASLDALAKDTAEVGSYLPKADGIEGFSLFVPDRSKTPALRAGTVDRENPYRLALPSSWREKQVANIQSGNYCQPRCAEPWTEVIFENPAEGKVQVIVSPLVRLTNASDPPLEDVGTPEGLLNSLGSYITGTYLDEEDVRSIEKKKYDGRSYYQYEAYATYGTLGPHTLTSVTVKGDLLMMLAISANDKQWAKGEKKLRQMLDTFRASA